MYINNLQYPHNKEKQKSFLFSGVLDISTFKIGIPPSAEP